ncbi:TetR/AcrR family transcriptional regulator [Herbaspirillum chlorophenolicum]|uniref:TetR/AcrR family transcriptional regulator n=1 Tax=Herbaspirillum chlorophenolicum TaxID=211589 RepID=A0ABW8F0K7_9BURK
MPKSTKPKASPKTIPRQRLARPERGRQLLDISWKLIGDEGTDALTLGRVAEVAGVSKPVVYEHFGTRNGLLAALYQDFDILQTERIDASVAAARPELNDKAGIIASSYVACVLTQGREIPGVLAALSGSPELATLKRQYQKAFIGKCHDALAAFAGTRGIPAAAMWAMLGAAESLSNAALAGDITQEQATAELQQTILGMVARSQ